MYFFQDLCRASGFLPEFQEVQFTLLFRHYRPQSSAHPHTLFTPKGLNTLEWLPGLLNQLFQLLFPGLLQANIVFIGMCSFKVCEAGGSAAWERRILLGLKANRLFFKQTRGTRSEMRSDGLRPSCLCPITHRVLDTSLWALHLPARLT